MAADPKNYVPTQFADNGALNHPAAPNIVDQIVTPKQKTITITSSATPVSLGDHQMRFRQLQFVPRAGNAGPVHIQIVGEDGLFADAPDGALPVGTDPVDWPAPNAGGCWDGQQFRLRAENNGDIVDINYA